VLATSLHPEPNVPINLPPVTLGLLIACIAAYLVQTNAYAPIMEQFALWPFGAYFRPWQLVSYFFLHGGLQHLLFNMLGLVTFGSDLERLWGPGRYLVLIVISTIAAALAQQAMSYASGDFFPTVGASGGIYGLLLAFALTFPNRIVTLIFPPIPMRARTFAIVFAGIELFSGVTGTMAGVAHFAHLGGMLGALILMFVWRYGPTAKRA
jgi:membrane associated rhomboid family serine protease